MQPRLHVWRALLIRLSCSAMAQSDRDYMMTAEEIRLRTRKRRKILLLLLLVFVLGTIVFFGARPAANLIKGWQSRRHADKAFALIEQEKWNEARNEVTAAYQLRPG